MANERLRRTMFERGETNESVASAVKVDPKTVDRWVGGRTPYTRSRFLLARHLQVEEEYLWPGQASAASVAAAEENELVAVHPHRYRVPNDTWTQLFDDAEEEIGMLVYSGMFVAENSGITAILRTKAEDGVRVRLLLGDPDSAIVRARGQDEGIDDGLVAKIRESLHRLRVLANVEGIEVRLHATTLYTSIYRSDDDLLVNPHVYGVPASDAPVLHLRRSAGGTMTQTYLNSFEKIWDGARPTTLGK